MLFMWEDGQKWTNGGQTWCECRKLDLNVMNGKQWTNMVWM